MKDRQMRTDGAGNDPVSRKTFDEVMFPCYKPFDMMLTRGHGAEVFDSDGRRYVDFTAGIAVLSLGHTPKGVRRVIRKQSSRLIHCSNVFTNESTLTLARELIRRCPDFQRVFFTNSGAEANECALKLARRAGFNNGGERKAQIISFTNSFHGRTLFSVTVGGQDKYSEGFGPRPGAITHLPLNDAAAFNAAISDDTCAVIVETIQGEGGIIPVDPQFLRLLRQKCTEHNAMLIFDEVQTGVGRTGSLFSYQNTEVVPDAITVAKGLGAGLPIGAVLARDEFARHFTPGTHGTTFGGNPVVCAVGLHVLRKIDDEKFLKKVREKGDMMRNEILALGLKTGVLSQVRGAGLLIGAVLSERYAGRAADLQQLCFREGLLTLLAGHDVLRIAPPLNIKTKFITEGLKKLESAMQAMADGRS